jgi:hypothetical protein
MTQSATIVAGQTEIVRGRLLRAEAEPRTPRAPAEPPARPAPTSTTGSIVIAGVVLPESQISVDGTPVAAGTREIPVTPGSHWLKLSAPGYRADSSQIEVRAGSRSQWAPPQLTALPKQIVVDIATPDTAIALGSNAQLRASVRDESGAPLNKPVVWESTNPEVARVERDGRVIGVGAGRAYVRARSENHVDSTLVAVLRLAKPVAEAPAEPAPPPDEDEATAPAAPAAPTTANIQAALDACTGAFGSRDEHKIVETYQAKSALDVTNLRKVLDIALKPEAKFEASVLKVEAPSVAKPETVDALFRFEWRNNAGVNKKKDAPVRLELKQAAGGWQLAACRATEKVSF